MYAICLQQVYIRLFISPKRHNNVRKQTNFTGDKNC